MQYEALFEKSSKLPQGSVTLQFVRCSKADRSRGVRCHHSDLAWSAADVERLHELSVQYFRKHGRKNATCGSYWIDCGQNGLAVKVKTDNMTMQPDRGVKYRLTLRRSVNRILKLQNQSPSPAGASSGLQSSLNVNCQESEPKRETFEVYVPVSAYKGLTMFPSFFLAFETGRKVHERISGVLPKGSCVRMPLAPFQAVKWRVCGEGGRLLVSVSGVDAAVSFMSRAEAEKCGIVENVGQVEQFSPPSIKPLIEEMCENLKKRYNSGPALEKNTGTSDGTTLASFEHESTDILGAPSPLAASDDIAPNAQSKKVDCLPLNSRGQSQTSADLSTVPANSSSFEHTSLNSQQSFPAVKHGNQTTLPDSVAFPSRNGEVGVPDFLPQDGLILKNSAISSTTSMPPISDNPAAVPPPEQFSDVSFSIKKLLAAGCTLLYVRNKKRDLDFKNINTFIHGSVHTKVRSSVGNITVNVPVETEGRSILCYTPSYDKDELLRFIENSPVNLVVFTRMKDAGNILIALATFHCRIAKNKRDFETTRVLKQIIDYHTWNVLANERQIDEASAIAELPVSQPSHHSQGILRAVAEAFTIERRFNSTRSDIFAVPQAPVQKNNFVTVVEQRPMASIQAGLKRKRYEYCATVVPETVDLPPTTKNNAIVPSSVTSFDKPASDQRQTSSPTSDGRLAKISRQPICLRTQFLTRGLFPSRLCHLPIVAASTPILNLRILVSQTTIRSAGVCASGIQQNKP